MELHQGRRLIAQHPKQRKQTVIGGHKVQNTTMVCNSTACVFVGPDVNIFTLSSLLAARLDVLVPIPLSSQTVSCCMLIVRGHYFATIHILKGKQAE